MSAPLLWGVAVLLGTFRLIWWLGANDHILAGSSKRQPGEVRDVDHCPPALAAFVLVGADSGTCFLPHQAATAEVADLVQRNILHATTDGDTATISLGNATELSSDDALLVHMLQTRMSRSDNDLAVVGSGTLAHHPPIQVWWLRYRRAIALRSRELGLSQQRPFLQCFFGISGVAAVIGIAGLAIALRSLVRAMTALDPLELNVWWLVLGGFGIRVAVDAFRTGIERSDVLTPTGRHCAVRLSHMRDRLVEVVSPNDGIGDSRDIAHAVALGIPTRVTRQIPLFSPHDEHLIWSSSGDSVRLTRVQRDWRPGEGTQPRVAIIAGLAATVIALGVRRAVNGISAGDWLTSLSANSPVAITDVERLLSIGGQAALLVLFGGICVAIAGFIDIFARRTFYGTVIGVRLPEAQTVTQKLREFLTGAGHDGVAIVEVTLDLEDSHRPRTIVVDARAAAPIGSEVAVEQTLLLRRVRSVAPRGRSGAEHLSGSTLSE